MNLCILIIMCDNNINIPQLLQTSELVLNHSLHYFFALIIFMPLNTLPNNYFEVKYSCLGLSCRSPAAAISFAVRSTSLLQHKTLYLTSSSVAFEN